MFFFILISLYSGISAVMDFMIWSRGLAALFVWLPITVGSIVVALILYLVGRNALDREKKLESTRERLTVRMKSQELLTLLIICLVLFTLGLIISILDIFNIFSSSYIYIYGVFTMGTFGFLSFYFLFRLRVRKREEAIEFSEIGSK